MVVPFRFPSRLLPSRLLVAAGFVLVGLVLFAGRAHALDTGNSTSASTPADTTSAPPVAANSDSTPPPTTPEAQPAASPPAGASGPNDTPPSPTTTQSSDASTSGTSIANTGGNTSTAADTPAPTTASSSPATNGTATADATSGSATAQGTADHAAIDQQAQAHTTDAGSVEILQIALVVNVGNAQSTSGSNVAGAGAGATGTNGSASGVVQSTDRTGNATAVGNTTGTGITQSAVVTNGDNNSQSATVLNVGIAIGNSGVNITIGRVDGSGTATTSTTPTATASVASGQSNATGDRSTSSIAQLAAGNASGTAQLFIDQRAIIVNFGIAIANTGANFSLSSIDIGALTPEEQFVVQALLGALVPMFESASSSTAPTAATMTTAAVQSGNANATGNKTTTSIRQTATGSVSGDATAYAAQRAQVANFGLAFANSGFNAAIAQSGLPAATGTDLVAAQTSLTQFFALLTNLDWLGSANPFASFAQSVNLDGITIDLGGTLTGTDVFAGWDSAFAPDGGPLPGGVHVRQISAVLNIGFALADSGDNVVMSVVTTGAGAATPIVSAGTDTSAVRVVARVVTGDAAALGATGSVTICQAFHDAVTCAPKVTPPPTPPGTTPTTRPVVTPVAAVIAASTPAPAAVPAPTTTPDPATSVAGALPFTGAETTPLAALGTVLLGLGAVLTRRRTRR